MEQLVMDWLGRVQRKHPLAIVSADTGDQLHALKFPPFSRIDCCPQVAQVTRLACVWNPFSRARVEETAASMTKSNAHLKSLGPTAGTGK